MADCSDKYNSVENHFANVSKSKSFEQFVFITVIQSDINQIEFEYPKNHPNCQPFPKSTLNVQNIGTSEGDFKSFMESGIKTNL